MVKSPGASMRDLLGMHVAYHAKVIYNLII